MYHCLTATSFAAALSNAIPTATVATASTATAAHHRRRSAAVAAALAAAALATAALSPRPRRALATAASRHYTVGKVSSRRRPSRRRPHVLAGIGCRARCE